MNAKKEFLKHIEGKNVICAKFKVDDFLNDSNNWVILKDKYTKKNFDIFCNKLDFDYNNSYGGQNLFGKILFKDSFSDRGEYDGSEWWENHKMPTIEEIINN